FPLDSTQIKFDEVRRDRLFAYGSPASDALTLLYHQWRLFNDWSQITPTLFDAVPVTALLQPSTCPLTSLRITVDDKGYTRPVKGDPNVSVCLVVDENATQQLIMDTLAPEADPRNDRIVRTAGGWVIGTAARGLQPSSGPQPSLKGAPDQPRSSVLTFKGIPY